MSFRNTHSIETAKDLQKALTEFKTYTEILAIVETAKTQVDVEVELYEKVTAICYSSITKH